MTIRTKILVPVLGISALLFSAAGTLAVLTTVRTAVAAAENQVVSTSERYAYSIEAILEGPFATVGTLATLFEDRGAIPVMDRRSYFLSMLRAIVDNNSSFVSIWSAWGPNAIDGSDDRFAGTGLGNESGAFCVAFNKGDSGLELVSLSSIRDITDEVRGASSEMTKGAIAAGGEMRRLLQLTEELRSSMDAIGHESEGIKAITGRVTELSERNAELLAKVESGTDRFRV